MHVRTISVICLYIVNENGHEAIGNEGVHPGNDIEQAEPYTQGGQAEFQTHDSDYRQ